MWMLASACWSSIKTNGNEIQKYIMRLEEEQIVIMFVINQFRESCNPVCFAKHKDCVAHIQGESV